MGPWRTVRKIRQNEVEGVGWGGGDLLWMSIPLFQGEVAIFPAPLCYANREKLRQYKLVSLSVELTFF